jgi:hypothetical protein
MRCRWLRGGCLAFVLLCLADPAGAVTPEGNLLLGIGRPGSEAGRGFRWTPHASLSGGLRLGDVLAAHLQAEYAPLQHIDSRVSGHHLYLGVAPLAHLLTIEETTDLIIGVRAGLNQSRLARRSAEAEVGAQATSLSAGLIAGALFPIAGRFNVGAWLQYTALFGRRPCRDVPLAEGGVVACSDSPADEGSYMSVSLTVGF